MKRYIRSSFRSEHRSEVTQALKYPDDIVYERWYRRLTPSQRRYIYEFKGEGPAYGPPPRWIPLPEEIK